MLPICAVNKKHDSPIYNTDAVHFNVPLFIKNYLFKIAARREESVTQLVLDCLAFALSQEALEPGISQAVLVTQVNETIAFEFVPFNKEKLHDNAS